ncbi:ParB/RepB/Spo0J family partition protein [Roseomonas sp. M0104]|uniref:ParB/RepB/Spo0J family partition protein n=1 Tax=Teichococcus coralli TaxID=2545983 RepID=A0A845BE23_9PROT|nr:ParB/RepB/Spo0J family partition protein [Pseudoroseomonas coralli]MXP64304.1 ParB/RepB/Spo0J family partition protein [Pseudoroseomonas coralli]
MSARKSPRLGMGLSALLGDQNAATPASPGASIPRTLPLETLEPGPFQPRGPIDQSGLAELAASIREHGVLQPLLVRPKPGQAGAYQIIGGERRWRAAQLAQRHEVPVYVHELDDRMAMAAALVENLQREDLNALEEARGYKRLLEEFGLTQDGLGQAVGKSRSHVANTLRLLSLPPKVREMLDRGSISAGHARALLTAPDPVKLAETVVTRGLNVRQTEALAAAAERMKPSARPVRPDADTKALERDLMGRLGLKVAIQHGKRGGRLTISYRDLDQLDGLVRLLSPHQS